MKKEYIKPTKRTVLLKSRLTILAFILLLCLTVGCSNGSDNDRSQEMSSVKVMVSIPAKQLPDYAPRTRSAEQSPLALRAVAEVYRHEGGDCLQHVSTMMEPTAEADVYSFTIGNLVAGEYVIYTWIDYSTDGNDELYDTSSLKTIGYKDDSHTVHADYRQAYYGKTTVQVSEGQSTLPETIKAGLAFAHYRIEAVDVAAYERMQHANGWPPLEETQVRVTYTSYVPVVFNALTGQPVDAVVGRSFTADVSIGADGKVVLADDYVSVTGSESEVTIRIEILNRNTQEVIATADGVVVNYRTGHLTTVSGSFLTADDALDGNVGVNTRWDGEYNIEF